MYNFVISYGLPGSGKSKYLKDLMERLAHTGYYSRSAYVDCDKLLERKRDKTLLEVITEEIQFLKERNYYAKKGYYILIDVLLTTNADLLNLLNVIKEMFEGVEYDITIEWWSEDRDACKWNDEYRRDETSINSIMNLPYEPVDLSLLKQELNIPIKATKHNVVRKSKEMHFAQNKNLCGNKGILTSDRWSLGGNCCDCWGGDFRVSADEPVEFTEFDTMLSELCPDISFLKYKKLFAECVEICEQPERDYYGGCVTYAYYECNVERLIELLFEMEIIKEED